MDRSTAIRGSGRLISHQDTESVPDCSYGRLVDEALPSTTLLEYGLSPRTFCTSANCHKATNYKVESGHLFYYHRVGQTWKQVPAVGGQAHRIIHAAPGIETTGCYIILLKI